MVETYIDPVCGMEVTPNSAQAVSEHEGQTYYFCSTECKVKFDQDREEYLEKAEENRR